MDYTYVALVIFLLLAIFVPLSMLLTAKMLGAPRKTNKTKTLNYESAEVPIGANKDIVNDYLSYFPLFLAFEIVGIIAIVWSFTFSNLASQNNFYLVLILGASTLLSLVTVSLVNQKMQ